MARLTKIVFAFIRLDKRLTPSTSVAMTPNEPERVEHMDDGGHKEGNKADKKTEVPGAVR